MRQHFACRCTLPVEIVRYNVTYTRSPIQMGQAQAKLDVYMMLNLNSCASSQTSIVSSGMLGMLAATLTLVDQAST